MHYVDSQLTIVRRDSSLILSRRSVPNIKHPQEVFRGQSSQRLSSISKVFLINRPKGSVQKEIITSLFESMLDSIVESWEVISQRKQEENSDKEVEKADISQPKKKKPAAKTSKSKKLKEEVFDDIQEEEILTTCWWTAPDEKAIIVFKNGNKYEGNISMKCMNGDGRFQWADGTVYLGHFKDNEIHGKGMIQWKDNTWYEGDFAGNLRHGKGLYVDSRKQCSYIGEWYSGTKHGQGAIYFSRTFKNSYDGEWNYNVRHGFGSREYSELSGYRGDWDLYCREGSGIMIWPNHDFYQGEWKNGVMSYYGTYIWNAYCSNSMSRPFFILYRGQWLKGKRDGYGFLNLGLGFGAHYKGEFKNNKKHGTGIFVTNNGFILQNKHLFTDDNLSKCIPEDNNADSYRECKRDQAYEPFKFHLCDDSVGLDYHIEQALRNIDNQHKVRLSIINKFLENNLVYYSTLPSPEYHGRCSEDKYDYVNLIEFELRSLRKSLYCYEADLKRIYYHYSTICNTEEITFTPILIRLYLWQLYYDCNIHEKGLTLVDIDKMFSKNPDWLAQSPHDPFEQIYFWQFRNSLISVAKKLYAKTQLPGDKPDNILANAFRTLMEKDILPALNRRKGLLVNGFGACIPLKSLYKLYRNLGEPHSLRTFLRATRRPPHYSEYPNSIELKETDIRKFLGSNVFRFGDEMTFVLDSYDHLALLKEKEYDKCERLKLFNFSDLSSKTIIKIFSQVFPYVSESNKIINLEIEITFLEFFEIFTNCALESITITDAERYGISLLDDSGVMAPPQSPADIIL